MKKIRNFMLCIVMIMCVAFTSTVALAADTCNHSWFIADTTGADCIGYTYLYRCSKCLTSKKETIPATTSHKMKETHRRNADCTRDGVIMGYCELCKELWKETTPALGHSYVSATNTAPTCTKDGTSILTCQNCGDRDIVVDVGSATGHKYINNWQVVKSATCVEKGVSKRLCTACSVAEYREDGFGDHSDKDKDYNCDLCGEKLSIFSPVTPDTPSESTDCSCSCHKGGISGFFWKIGNFFNKLFKIKSKQICSCGVYHF